MSEKRDRVSIIAYMVMADGVQHNFSLEEFAALFIWAESIIKDEWKIEFSEENLEKAIYDIFNNRTGEEDP